MIDNDHFKEVMQKVFAEVFGPDGKGFKRHGGDNVPLKSQPWYYVSTQIGGPGFLIGQAIKKLSELRTKPDYNSWSREMLGAIVYCIFAQMWADENPDTVGENGAILKNSSDLPPYDKIKEFHESYEYGGEFDNNQQFLHEH